MKPFWADLEPHQEIEIATLRSELVQLMKEGFDKIPLTSLLVIIKTNCLYEEVENVKSG